MEDLYKTILTVQKNEEEEVRLSVRTYKDRIYYDLRIWFKPLSDGEWHPTKKGITLLESIFFEVVRKLADGTVEKVKAKRGSRKR